MQNEKQDKPWYREPYVWLLITFPLAAVLGGLYTTKLAIQSNDGLVVDDYYKKGMEINRVLERDRIASDLEITAEIQLSRENGTFRIFLTGNNEFILPETVNVSFLHSTRSGYDYQLLIKRQGSNLYQATLPELVKGRWHIQIETENWRVLDSLTIS